MTTATFSADAKKEALRDGAPPMGRGFSQSADARQRLVLNLHGAMEEPVGLLLTSSVS